MDLLRSLAVRALGLATAARPKVGTRFGAPPRLAEDWIAGDDSAARSPTIPEANLLESVQQFGNTES